ncbi:MAG: tRNA (guanosine(37)-N1)-methyltransferase TrmD [Candidatus Paceibacterota bacterium]
MRFDIITIFPDILSSYSKESILGRAQKKGLIEVNFHDLRDYTTDKHRTTDDTPFGGGPGMVMMVEPIFKAVEALSAKYEIRNTKYEKRVILLSPKGKKFDQKMAKRLSKYDQLVFICGRYEGVDERVKEYIADEEISIGDYVLSGGELPAIVIVEAVSRLIPGVLGNKESLESESHTNVGDLDFLQYTRPAEFITGDGKKLKVPEILLSGDHAKIKKWREETSKKNIKNIL